MNETFAFSNRTGEWAMTTPPPPARLRRYIRHGTLPQLAALEAVVRLGSATRAAEALCIAQPTLSGQLRKLSDALGVRLFDLRGKRLVPTAAACTVLQAAREVAEALERCEAALSPLRAEAPGRTGDGVVTDIARASTVARAEPTC